MLKSPAALSPSCREALLAAVLVECGSCIRGRLLFVLGLPLVLAGLFMASRAMWNVDRQASDDPPESTGWETWALASLAIVGLLAPMTVGGLTYDVLKRGYFLAALLAVLVRPSVAASPGRALARALRFAAAAGSLAVEDVGLAGVPDRRSVLVRRARERVRRAVIPSLTAQVGVEDPRQ